MGDGLCHLWREPVGCKGLGDVGREDVRQSGSGGVGNTEYAARRRKNSGESEENICMHEQYLSQKKTSPSDTQLVVSHSPEFVETSLVYCIVTPSSFTSCCKNCSFPDFLSEKVEWLTKVYF